ncbi:MAG: hypothetical protein AAF798_11095 [Bacteroidota bacterium]
MKQTYSHYDVLKRVLNQFDERIITELWPEIRANSKVMHLKKNEILIPISKVQTYSYFIVAGSFVTSFISADGVEKAVWFNFDDQFRIVISANSYFYEEPSIYKTTAAEHSTVIRFAKRQVDEWAAKSSAFNQMYFQDVVNYFVSLQELMAYKLSHTPLQFLSFLKGKYPSYFERLSSKHLAHFAGVSPEWYSKLKKRL